MRIGVLRGVIALTVAGLAQPGLATPPPVKTAPTSPPIAKSVVPAAHGDWPQWRGNPGHTGFQALPARIVTPTVEWRYHLGGAVSADQVLVQSPGTSGEARIFVATGGRLQCFDASGGLIFDRNPRLRMTLIGTWDFGGDGTRQILAATSGIAGNRLLLFDASGGDLLWEGPETEGQVGAVKVLTSGSGYRLLWLPAASSRVTLLDFTGRVTAPETVWQTEVPDLLSDPYTFSALGFSDLDHDGTSSVVIAGARGSVAVTILDAEDGKERFRVTYPDVNGLESGGERQLLYIGDLDGSGHDQILCVSGHSSDSQFMFQGATVTDPTDPGVLRVFDTAPVGLRYVPGSVADLDGDGRLELLVSRYDLNAGRHDLLMLDAATLTIKSSRPNVLLLSVTRRTDGSWDLLGLADAVSELPQIEGSLVGLRIDPKDRTFREIWRRSDPIDLSGSLVRVRSAGSSRVDNVGFSPVVLLDDGMDFARAVFRRPRGTSGGADLIAVRLSDGTIQGTYGPTSPFDVLGAFPGRSRTTTCVVLGLWGGEVAFLDGSLTERRRATIGGYSQNEAANGHSFELAAVADFDGAGRRDIAVIDSQNRILRLLRSAPGTAKSPGTQVLASNTIPQELCIASKGPAKGLFLVGWTAAGPKLSMIDGSGGTIWTHVFESDPGGPAEDAQPVGLNVGTFGPAGSLGVLVTVGSTRSLPRATYALDLGSGMVIWKTSGVGGWWDANAAVADVDGDGRDDVLINANLWKAFLVDGTSGEQAGGPLILPAFDDLGPVDYNGAPVVVRRGVDGMRVLVAQDDAHLSLMSVGEPCGADPSCPARLFWASPQTHVDSERRSMAALAPISGERVLIGVGSNAGELRAVRESDGSDAWRITLAGGQVTSDPSARSNPLSSVLALDVNGDGRVDFVVGGADGWLYALDAESGRLVWSIDLGAPVGDPVAADFDNIGSSKILVPASDGFLYAIGPASASGASAP